MNGVLILNVEKQKQKGFMEKDIIVLDHISLLKSADLDGHRIQKLSQNEHNEKIYVNCHYKIINRMFSTMSRRRERMVKVKRIFNTKFQ